MKMLALLTVVLVLVAGCWYAPLLYEEYEIGAAIQTINGLTVSIRAMLWTYEDSGSTPRPDTWGVLWGDGTRSDNDDGLKMEAIWRWDHTYLQTGSFTILITHPGADPVALIADIE